MEWLSKIFGEMATTAATVYSLASGAPAGDMITIDPRNPSVWDGSNIGHFCRAVEANELSGEIDLARDFCATIDPIEDNWMRVRQICKNAAKEIDETTSKPLLKNDLGYSDAEKRALFTSADSVEKACMREAQRPHDDAMDRILEEMYSGGISFPSPFKKF